MPNIQQHIDRAIANYHYLVHLPHTHMVEWDWSIVVQFYCMLHLTKAHLLSEGVRPDQIDSHKKIRAVLYTRAVTDKFFNNPIAADSNNQPVSCQVIYANLQSYSERARYLTTWTNHKEGKAYKPPLLVNGISEWMEAVAGTALMLEHFLNNHPQIAHRPFNLLSQLPPITLTNPNAPTWMSTHGLMRILN
jgi:hypothetical protein